MDKVISEGAIRVGVDLAKRVIQVHAVDAVGCVLTGKAVARGKFIEWCVSPPDEYSPFGGADEILDYLEGSSCIHTRIGFGL